MSIIIFCPQQNGANEKWLSNGLFFTKKLFLESGPWNFRLTVVKKALCGFLFVKYQQTAWRRTGHSADGAHLRWGGGDAEVSAATTAFSGADGGLEAMMNEARCEPCSQQVQSLHSGQRARRRLRMRMLRSAPTWRCRRAQTPAPTSDWLNREAAISSLIGCAFVRRFVHCLDTFYSPHANSERATQNSPSQAIQDDAEQASSLGSRSKCLSKSDKQRMPHFVCPVSRWQRKASVVIKPFNQDRRETHPIWLWMCLKMVCHVAFSRSEVKILTLLPSSPLLRLFFSFFWGKSPSRLAFLTRKGSRKIVLRTLLSFRKVFQELKVTKRRRMSS